MIFTERLVKADEVKVIGLLLDAVSSEKVMPAVMKLAQQIAAKPPQATRLMKAAQRRVLADFLDLYSIFQAMRLSTDDYQKAASTFVENTRQIIKANNTA